MSISASGRPVGPAPRWIIVGFHLCAWPSLDLPPDETARHWRRHFQSADLIYDSYLMLWAGSMMMRPRKPLAHVLGGECRVWASMAAHDFRPGRRVFFPRTVTAIQGKFWGQFGPVDCSLLTSFLEHLFFGGARAWTGRKKREKARAKDLGLVLCKVPPPAKLHRKVLRMQPGRGTGFPPLWGMVAEEPLPSCLRRGLVLWILKVRNQRLMWKTPLEAAEAIMRTGNTVKEVHGGGISGRLKMMMHQRIHPRHPL